MTVTSAFSASPGASALDQLGSSYAHGMTEKSHDHSDSFSRILHEDIQKHKEESSPKTSAHQKAHKADTGSERAASAEAPSAKQGNKTALTGKFGLLNQVQQSKDAPGGAAEDGASLADEVLAGTAMETSSASVTMAMLLKANTGSASMFGQVSKKDETSQDESSKEQLTSGQQTDPTLSLAAPMPMMLPQPSELDAAMDAAKKSSNDGVSGVKTAGAKGSDETNPVDSEEGKPAGAGAPGHLAFALRLNASLDAAMAQAAELKEQSQTTLENSSIGISAPATASASMNETAAGSEKKEHSPSDSKDQGGAAAMVDMAAPAASHPPDVAGSQWETPAAAPVQEIDDKLLEYSTDTVRNVQMQVVGDDNRRVDIRLMDRAGELRVSVKSGDSALNKTLQSSMPDLTSRLQSAQYETEVWMPTAATQTQASGESSTTDGPMSQQQRPNWVADLDGATSRNTERIQ